MFATRFLGASLLTSIAALSMATISMTTNVSDGQSIKGSFSFEVKVTSDVLVSSVEFYVGDDLRDTDESTPYRFTIDTLTEQEGPVTVTFNAFNTNGESVKKSFNIKIDNVLGKGIDFHIDRATTLNRDGKYLEAVDAARVALKIDKENNQARMVMARANYSLGKQDIAQKFAEDVIFSDANNNDAKALLAAINLKRAFFVNTTNPTERNEIVSKALKSAAESEASVLNGAAEKAGMSNNLDVIDTNLRARRFVQVAAQLRPNWEKNIDEPTLTNRLLYSLIMSGRLEEAHKVLRTVERYGSPDAYTFALKTVASQMTGDTKGADAAEKEVILENPNADITKYTQIYLGINRGNVGSLAGFIADLEKNAPNTVGVNLFKSAHGFLTSNFSQATDSYQSALLSDPASVPVLIERGHQVLQSVFAKKLTGTEAKNEAGLALAFYEAALAANPSSVEALCAVANIHMLNGDAPKALSFARAAVGAGPEYGGSHYVLAGALRLAQVEALKDVATRGQATAYR